MLKCIAPPHLLQRGIEKLVFLFTYDVDDLIDWADAINVLRIQRERMGVGLIPSIREYRTFFGITNERLIDIKKN